MSVTRAVPVAAACLGLVPLLTGCVVHVDSGGYTARKEQRFSVTGRPTIDLDTFDGAIEVQAWNKPEVHVVIETKASSKVLLEGINIETDHDDARVALKVTAPGNGGWNFETGGVSRSAKLIATVPIDSEVRLRSGDGSVLVERVRGVIHARTDDGRIVMRDVGGEIVADSGDGSVQMEDVDGRCTVSTRDGSVLVSGRLRGGLKATSGDGSVTVRAAEGSEVDEDWQIETADGGVVLALPERLDTRLDARTNDGRISLNGYPDLTVDRDGEGRSLQTVFGNGTRVMKVRTGDGSITLKRVFVPTPPAPPAPPPPPAPPAVTEP